LVDNRSLNNLDSFYTQFNFPGFYPVSISVESIEGCRFELDKTIEVLPSNYTVPNIYTPNGDGINDCFTPKGNDIISYELTVLNRWGVSLLENSSSCWDGRLKSGEKASDGTYFYQLVIRFIDGTKSYEKGSVYLLR
jgi:gliding motility-associated-like protein